MSIVSNNSSQAVKEQLAELCRRQLYETRQHKEFFKQKNNNVNKQHFEVMVFLLLMFCIVYIILYDVD